MDWTRMAEPQPDGYDSVQALSLVRRQPMPGLREFTPEVPVETRFFEGCVPVGPASGECPYDGFEHAPPDHPNIGAAQEYVRLWPEAYRQFQSLIRHYCPILNPQDNTENSPSCSGCRESDFGLIYATVEHPATLAEALVHEMAHQKLFALGIGMEGSVRLVRNDPADLFVSPVIRERPRPMTAVLHAEYSFVHIAKLDADMFLALHEKEDSGRLLYLLGYALVRIEEGLDEIRRNVETDREGGLFLDGFYRWASDVIDEGNRILNRCRYPKPELPVPAYL